MIISKKTDLPGTFLAPVPPRARSCVSHAESASVPPPAPPAPHAGLPPCLRISRMCLRASVPASAPGPTVRQGLFKATIDLVGTVSKATIDGL
jgi:hypothetical protein